MGHEQAFLICENKCKVPGYSKEQIDELLKRGSLSLVDKNTGEEFGLWVGTKEEYDALPVHDSHTIYYKTNDATVPNAEAVNGIKIETANQIPVNSETIPVKIKKWEGRYQLKHDAYVFFNDTATLANRRFEVVTEHGIVGIQFSSLAGASAPIVTINVSSERVLSILNASQNGIGNFELWVSQNYVFVRAIYEIVETLKVSERVE